MKHLFALFLFLSLTSFAPRPITVYPVVGYKELSFSDKNTRGSRSLFIWYPVSPKVTGSTSSNLWDVFKIAQNSPIANPETKKPVIILSHGYGGSPHQLSWLISNLVYNDYIVLGIQHLDEFNGEAQINHWQRAQDIHTFLDQFSSNPFSDAADLDRIGIAGFSIGGTTAIWCAGGKSTQLDHFIPGPNDANPEEFGKLKNALPKLNKQKMSQDWTDSRIKAAFLMAPAWAWIFDKKGLQNIRIPTYIVAPQSDTILQTENNAGFFANNIPNAIYQIIPSPTNHYVFIAEPKDPDKVPPKLDFLLANNPDVDRTWVQSEVAENATSFFDSVFSYSPQPKSTVPDDP